jgi:hypothetical protein
MDEFDQLQNEILREVDLKYPESTSNQRNLRQLVNASVQQVGKNKLLY